MKEKTKGFLLGMVTGSFLTVAVLAVAGIIAGLMLLNSSDTLEEVGKPPEEMARRTGLPFSEKTRDIHHFILAGGMQELVRYCKFTCDASEAEVIAEDFITQNEKLLGKSPSPDRPRIVATSSPFGLVDHQRFPELKWWDLDQAKIVKEIRIDASHGYHVWIASVDERTSCIYIFQMD